MQEEKLVTELEGRNRFLEAEIYKLKIERYKCSRRASGIILLLPKIQGEIEANKKVIQKLKINK